MQEDKKHTSLPWGMDGDGFDSVAAQDFGTDGYAIFRADEEGHFISCVADIIDIADDDEAQANAEFIVRAVNGYYPMLKALKEVLSVLNDTSIVINDGNIIEGGNLKKLDTHVKNIISKAEGK